MTIADTSSDLAFAGQSAFLTGGGSGIGLECARRLVLDGASVTIAGRSAERLAGAVAELEALAPAGVSVAAAPCDVADEAQVAAAVAVAVANGPTGLDLVVAAAGRGGLGPIITTSLEEWEGIVGTNLTGTFLTFKHAGAAVARSGGGAMVAISSIAGVSTHRFMGPYCVSKAGIDMLVQNLADELGVAGVRVNSVRPGLVETELVDAVMADASIVGDYLDQMPVRRVGPGRRHRRRGALPARPRVGLDHRRDDQRGRRSSPAPGPELRPRGRGLLRRRRLRHHPRTDLTPESAEPT